MNTYEPFAFGRALAASGLTTKAKVTGFCLAVYADGKTGYCYPTQEQLAESSSQSVLTVTRALVELKTAGFVTIARNERKRFNRNNQYWLRVPFGTLTPPAAVDEQPAAEPEPRPPEPAKSKPQGKPPAPSEPAANAFPTEPAWLRG